MLAAVCIIFITSLKATPALHEPGISSFGDGSWDIEIPRKKEPSLGHVSLLPGSFSGGSENRGLRPVDVVRQKDVCCYNGGTCHIAVGLTKAWCMCPAGFTGLQCEEDVNECTESKPCGDHEICINTYGGYTCRCKNGFLREGEDCIPKETCEEFPCLNGAECEDTPRGHFRCICPLGFTGTRCDKKIPECEDSSCSASETCISTPVGFRCVKAE